MLIGVFHNRNGDFEFSNLIYGSDKRPDIDEFLARLIQLNDKFEFNEDEFEKQNQLNSSFRTPDFNYSSTFHNDHGFSHPTLMNFNRNPSEYSQFLHSDRMNLTMNDMCHLNINPNDGDNEDDDDEEQTPTVNRPPLKFPK